ncbi:MAG TPA: hypothetical protein VJ044_06070, partial [Candidatus Hodarchaeales archaeon]|nr:hypothetical protein [Candidatus Hodarchaeales archaeon]
MRPIILELLGCISKPIPLTIPAKISRNVASKIGWTDILRVHLDKQDGIYQAVPSQAGGSGILRNIVNADGFVIVPEMSEGLKEGDVV